MADALIGYSGYVGGTLLGQRRFEALYRSTNIGAIDGRQFATVVCAGAPAQKWVANREPEADRRKIEALMAHLHAIRCETFVLISTVDVFSDPVGIDEDTPVIEEGLHPYGLHRRLLEKFVESRFSSRLIVRLPGLVGPGLRKNAIFDLLHDNNVHAIDARGVFQFYPMVNLWYDIRAALEGGLELVHLTAEPISMAEISRLGFGRDFDQALGAPPPAYDMRTRHAKRFGGAGHYQYGKRETLQAVRAYAQSEPKAVAASAAGAR